MLLSFLKEKMFLVVFAVSLFIGLGLAKACWQMNFWPTDAEVYYMPAAKDLFTHQYLSQIHQSLDEERIKWLHGKEMHVLAIALLQRLMNDTQSLRPLIVLGVVAVFISSLLIYLIARRLWGKTSAIVVWFLFATSFWPYLYVLFTKHQTQGLLFFLLSAVFLVYSQRSYNYFVAGICMGIAIFSSTVSMLYMPLILAAFMLDKKKILQHALLFAVGFMALLLYVNWPNVFENIHSYIQYVNISGRMNHFFYNQKVLAEWLPYYDLKSTRGGLWWVIKYLVLVIPFILGVYLICLKQMIIQKRKYVWMWVCFSLSAVIMAETKGVAQYGANYFPVIIGLLVFIGWSLKEAVIQKWWFLLAFISLGWNVSVMAGDVYPSRMVTTKISDFLEEQKITEVYTFRQHPLRPNIIDHLNLQTLQNLRITPIESIVQVNQGYIIVPPISTDSIYRASNGDYNDFDSDLLLNTIARQGKLKDYAIAGFRTLGSSLIWSQEEEIFAYRYLMRGQFKNSALDKAWILDGAKISRDRAQLMPTAQDLFLFQSHVRNIGTSTRQFMYGGYQSGVTSGVMLKGLAARIYKMGNPKDSLRVFVFKLDDKQPMWVPYAPEFISKPLDAKDIGSNKDSEPVIFTFAHPLQLNPGPFYVVIYRTGQASDQDSYRIYADQLGRLEQ